LIEQGYRDSGFTIEGMFGGTKQHLPCVQKGYPAGDIEIEMPSPDCCPCIFVKPRYDVQVTSGHIEAKAEKTRTVCDSLDKICKLGQDKEKFEKAAALITKMIPHASVNKTEGGVEIYKFLSIAMEDPLRASRTTQLKALYKALFDACLARKEIFSEAEMAQIELWQDCWMTLRTVTLTDDSYEFPKACRALLKSIKELPAYEEDEDEFRGVNNSLEGAYRPGAVKLEPHKPAPVKVEAVVVKKEESPRRSPRLQANQVISFLPFEQFSCLTRLLS